jgi:hypothetical protein
MRRRLAIIGLCAAGLCVALPIAIAVLMWALHPRFAPRGRAAYESCNAKLKQIYWAQLMWCEDKGGDTNMLVSIADLVGTNAYFSKPPACPEGGSYTLGRAGDYPQCSIPMHSLEFGRVIVANEAGAPMAGVEVSLELPGKPPRHCQTDHTGATWLTRFPASEVSVEHSGYRSSTIELPSKWPIRIVLQR